MNIYVNIRQLGKKRNTISTAPFHLDRQPRTLRELIMETVHTCVSVYNERVRQGDNVQAMTEERMQELETIGKLAFDVNYGGREADERKAINNALQGFADGLYRVFHGETELIALDAPLTIRENDEFTFIRLTMLTGAMW